MFDQKAIIVGAVGGFLAAVGVDLHAWGGGDPFNWKKAVARWVGGAIAGAVGATGLHLGGVA